MMSLYDPRILLESSNADVIAAPSVAPLLTNPRQSADEVALPTDVHDSAASQPPPSVLYWRINACPLADRFAVATAISMRKRLRLPVSTLVMAVFRAFFGLPGWTPLRLMYQR